MSRGRLSSGRDASFAGVVDCVPAVRLTRALSLRPFPSLPSASSPNTLSFSKLTFAPIPLPGGGAGTLVCAARSKGKVEEGSLFRANNATG